MEQSVPPIVLKYKERLFSEPTKTDDDDEEENLRMLQVAVDKQTIAQVFISLLFSLLSHRRMISQLFVLLIIDHQCIKFDAVSGLIILNITELIAITKSLF